MERNNIDRIDSKCQGRREPWMSAPFDKVHDDVSVYWSAILKLIVNYIAHGC